MILCYFVLNLNQFHFIFITRTAQSVNKLCKACESWCDRCCS